MLRNECEASHLSTVSSDPESRPHASSTLHLIPRPSEHAADPLRWSLRRKCTQLFVYCVLAFCVVLAPNCNQLAYVAQAPTYHVTPTQMSYGGALVVGGFAIGSLMITPLASLLGRPTLLLLMTLSLLCFQVWGAEMTAQDDYILLLLSRLFASLVAGVTPVLGTGMITDIFYLHQRGRAFAVFEISFILGVLVSPTVGGFIVQNPWLQWPWTFWWTVPLLAAAALLSLVLLEDTRFDRHAPQQPPPLPSGLRGRFATFFTPWLRAPPPSLSAYCADTVAPLILMVSPVALIPGLFTASPPPSSLTSPR